MGAVSLLVHLVFKTFFLALPVGVAWLAFRRLSMSESQNAWLYSGVGLFASVAAAGLAPWALGFTGASWIFLLLALMCPPIWIATVMLCDIHSRSYGDENAVEWVNEKFVSRREADTPAPQSPLILTSPVNAEVFSPVFRHRRPNLEPPLVRPIAERPEPQVAEPMMFVAPKPAPVVQQDAIEEPKSDGHRRVLDVARDMRGDGARHLRPGARERDASLDLPFLSGTA